MRVDVEADGAEGIWGSPAAREATDWRRDVPAEGGNDVGAPVDGLRYIASIVGRSAAPNGVERNS